MGPRFTARRSAIHGRGLFARRCLREGERILEYRGEVISWAEASRRAAASTREPFHTMLFERGDGTLIDASVGGNGSRWINHSCDPNCWTERIGRRVIVSALRDIAVGEELTFDYRLRVDGDAEEIASRYACRCGSADCRGSMVA